MGEWKGPLETGLLTAPHECCERPNLFVAGTTRDGETFASVLRCASCEKFSFPPPLGRDGAYGRPGWGKHAEWRFMLFRRAVERAYGAE